MRTYGAGGLSRQQVSHHSSNRNSNAHDESVGTWPGVRRTASHMCTLHPSLSSLVWLERCN